MNICTSLPSTLLTKSMCIISGRQATKWIAMRMIFNECIMIADEALRVEKEQVALMNVEMLRVLCQAILRLSVALLRAGLCSVPEPAFGSASHRFNQRFESFQRIVAPPALTYDHFLQATDASGALNPSFPELCLYTWKMCNTTHYCACVAVGCHLAWIVLV